LRGEIDSPVRGEVADISGFNVVVTLDGDGDGEATGVCGLAGEEENGMTMVLRFLGELSGEE
jgi:hypothetical protein